MSDKPKILPAADRQLFDLVERQLRLHSLRLKPGTTVADLVELAKSHGLTFAVESGTLCGDVQGTPAHLPNCFESLAERHSDKFFPRSVKTGVSSKDQLDLKGKAQFVSEHGLAAWEQLPLRASDAPPTQLDPNTLTGAEYAKLDRATKSACISAWGNDVIRAVVARKAKK